MIIQGNAIQIPLRENSVHCCVTSPPYWGLRKYQGEKLTVWGGAAGCRHNFGKVDSGFQEYELSDMCERCGAHRCAFGLEPTIEQYVEHSILILREVRRVLRDDGLCWWNLGDSYAANRGYQVPDSKHVDVGSNMGRAVTNGLKPLDLCLIPERVALAAQADGWYVRSLVIWAKPNPMPESVNGWRWERHRVKVAGEWSKQVYNTEDGHSGHVFNRPGTQWADCPGCEKCSPNDGLLLRKGSWRPTDAYEHILMLAKSADYFGDAEAVKERAIHAGKIVTLGEKSLSKAQADGNGVNRSGNANLDAVTVADGRNLRNVWTFPTQPYPEAHFATFPERLPEICIKASTSESGCCPKCGANWVRVIDRSVEFQSGSGKAGNKPAGKWEGTGQDTSGDYDIRMDPVVTNSTLGWRPSCACNAGEPIPCTVLDPFGGSGTTARVATRLRRRAVSVDLAYHPLAGKRTRKVQIELALI